MSRIQHDQMRQRSVISSLDVLIRRLLAIEAKIVCFRPGGRLVT
jgi:hypothetical protein